MNVTIKRLFLIIAAMLIAASSYAQKVKFNPANARGNVRADVGAMFATDNDWDAAMFQFTYSKLFWNQFAWRTGVQFTSETPGFEQSFGIPVGISYCPGIVPLGASLIAAAEWSVIDIVRDGLEGRTDEIGSDILANFLIALFRRIEYHAGLTPIWYGGEYFDPALQSSSRFGLTADVGIVLSIPIRHITFNISPTYHYSLTKNYFDEYGSPVRHVMSVGLGLGYLF
jgi:hypothetical protein